MKTASAKRRYLALWFPRLPTDRLCRQEKATGAAPDDAPRDKRPVVVAIRENNTQRIAALDGHAAELGLAPGLPLADARARVPDLRVFEADPVEDRALLSRIADWCDRYTPLVADDGTDGLILEIGGSAHLFGGEEGLVADIERRLRRAGLTLRLAVTDTPGSARTLARYGEGGIVTGDALEARIRPLPVAALELEHSELQSLRRAGLETLGALADRPERPLAARFGEALTRRLNVVLGRQMEPLMPRRAQPHFRAERQFPDPIGLTEDIEAASAGLANEICEALERAGKGGRVFELVFFRADGDVRRVGLSVSRPLRDAARLTRLLALRLDALPDPLDPGFGFDLIRLNVMRAEAAKAAQKGLDGRAAETDDFAELVDRLANRFGPAAVHRFLAEDSHWPERAARSVSALSSKASMAGKADIIGKESDRGWLAELPGDPPVRPFLVFTPPQEIETLAEVPDGPPYRFRWRRLFHQVARSEGPERISREWWRESGEALTRDYFRVEDTEGRRFWLFREGILNREVAVSRWYIHGLFA